MELLKGEPFWTVRPKAGFCIKAIRIPSLLDSRSNNNNNSDPVPNNSNGKQKVFVNVCTCDELPAPKRISEPELAEILESDNPGSYKIPLSLGDAHYEVDKSGLPCLAYDVIVNGRFFEESVKPSELFRTFLALICVDALYDKYQVQLDKRNWTILKHRKQVGEIKPQNIRQKAKPLIEELHSESIVSSPVAVEEGTSAEPKRTAQPKGTAESDGTAELQNNRQKAKPLLIEKLNSSPIVPSEKETTAELEDCPEASDAEKDSICIKLEKNLERNGRLGSIEPEYALNKDRARNPTKLIGRFYLPFVESSSHIGLQVSEDGRILLKGGVVKKAEEVKKMCNVSKSLGVQIDEDLYSLPDQQVIRMDSCYSLDIYVPYRLRPDDVIAVFHVDKHILMVKFPLS